MDDHAIKVWLETHGLTLEQSFVDSLRVLAREFKKTMIFV